jgi:tRNA (guanine37-N1)-methyltransferase
MAFITIHPKIIDAYKVFGIFKASESQTIAHITSVNLRDYAADKHGSVDDSPYGGGDGMVMRPDCLDRALAATHDSIGRDKETLVIATSPSGKVWNQGEAHRLASSGKSFVFICGRFSGIDQRFLDRRVDLEYSLGDVVYAGGELPSLLIAESILRLIPGVLGHTRSAIDDSFGEGMKGLLEHPVYTRPLEWDGQKVPDVLLTGDHQAITRWRNEESLKKTSHHRPDLLNR